MTDPTPADAARDVIALRDALANTLAWHLPDPNTGLLTASDVKRRLNNAGYDIVQRGDGVRVSREDLESALDAMSYVQDTYFWDKWKYQEPYDRLTAAIAAGADDGAL